MSSPSCHSSLLLAAVSGKCFPADALFRSSYARVPLRTSTPAQPENRLCPRAVGGAQRTTLPSLPFHAPPLSAHSRARPCPLPHSPPVFPAVAEGPRYPCPGTAQPDLYACLAAGCCFDENAPTQCYSYPYADEPLQASFPVPAGTPAGTCWDVVDVFGYPRGNVCEVGGSLTVNVTDGPAYYL